MSVDGVVYYRVQNATLAVANITNADAATRLLAQTTLRNVLGTKNLSQILSDREEIAHNMQVTFSSSYTRCVSLQEDKQSANQRTRRHLVFMHRTRERRGQWGFKGRVGARDNKSDTCKQMLPV